MAYVKGDLAIEVREVIRAALDYAYHLDFVSYDLFDALTSTVLDRTTRGHRLLRRLAIQAVRYSPVNVRGLVGARPMRHTKAVSDHLSILVKLAEDGIDLGLRLDDPEAVLKELISLSRADGNGVSWGLRFPYATRFVDADPSTPNLFNTVNAGNAVAAFHKWYRDAESRRVLEQVVSFVLNGLGVVNEGEQGAWLRYYPGQQWPIYNVNAMVASFLQRAASLGIAIPGIDDVIGQLIVFLCNEQGSDGSWPYARHEKGRWIDGFHTGYVVEALLDLSQTRSDAAGWSSALAKAINFYLEHLFFPDGFPKYYVHKPGALESQNAAQAIQTLALINKSGMANVLSLLENCVQTVLAGLYDSRGFFYYRRGRWVTIRQPFVRWSQMPMILALLHAHDQFVTCV